MIQDQEAKQRQIEQGLEVISGTERPVPGQSLTSNPESPRPFEGPPKYTNLREANQAIFATLIEEENFSNVVRSLGKGVPVGDLASALLYAGFLEGQWNPDLMLALVEPTMYMIMAMGERVGIDDMRLYAGEDEDVQDDPEYANKLNEAADMSNFVRPNISVNENSISNTLQEKLANLDVDSLLDRKEIVIDQESLLAQTPQEQSQEEIRG
jgi:hypothetical protein